MFPWQIMQGLLKQFIYSFKFYRIIDFQFYFFIFHSLKIFICLLVTFAENQFLTCHLSLYVLSLQHLILTLIPRLQDFQVLEMGSSEELKHFFMKSNMQDIFDNYIKQLKHFSQRYWYFKFHLWFLLIIVFVNSIDFCLFLVKN